MVQPPLLHAAFLCATLVTLSAWNPQPLTPLGDTPLFMALKEQYEPGGTSQLSNVRQADAVEQIDSHSHSLQAPVRQSVGGRQPPILWHGRLRIGLGLKVGGYSVHTTGKGKDR